MGVKDIPPWPQYFIRKGLQAVDDKLGGDPGLYCIGNEVTMADVFLSPQLNHAKMYGVKVAQEFPRLEEINDNLLK
eukprot:CAMPEP_0197011212 /NCGR_PEP_ID=MMETSP1380-20130617/57594_1 /TAXON_ID=5936 /ORGANISM="Euplotes crassus, Strain CT5" /LENGTH=75 /DNA_ID=CAMNT_0042433731 /DNA_START=169 /DNA_END=393 /DNA_ORIENTATION=-